MRKVSIMMLSYNRSAFIKLALQYLFAHLDYPIQKFVLVDNGSTDDTIPWVKNYLIHLGTEFPLGCLVGSSQVIENGKNFGIARAQNQGALACDPDSDVVMVSNDVFVGPNWLAPLVKCVEYHKEQNVKLGWVSPYLSPENTCDIVVSEQFRHQYFSEYYRRIIHATDPDYLREVINEIYGGSFEQFSKEFVQRNAGKRLDEAPSMIFYWTRECIDEVGLFDEQFSEFRGIGGWGNEDTDLYIRMNNLNYFRAACFDSFAHHVICATTRKIVLDDPNFAYGDIQTGGKFLRKWCAIPNQPIIQYPLETCMPKRHYDRWLLRKHNTQFGDLTKLDLGLTPEERKKIDEDELRAQGVLV